VTDLDTALGSLAILHDDLAQVLAELRRGTDRGGVSSMRRMYWDPAAPDSSHPLSAEYDHDGTFAAFGVFNLSTGAIRVAFTPEQSLYDTSSAFTLSARCYMIQPYRGTTISVSGAAAGSALIVAYSDPQPAAAGAF
jgi:hypothetical protein